MLRPADLTFPDEIERTASLLQPETLHFTPLAIRPNVKRLFSTLTQ